MLFERYKLGNLLLKNRVVMAPMTRNRATRDHVPTAVMGTYYAQRAGAGLIISEGTSPSSNGVGYARMPGLYNREQFFGWRLITDAVHKAGGKIFLQLMHTGRVAQYANLPAGTRPVGPSSATCSGMIWTDAAGMQPFSVPTTLSTPEIEEMVNKFALAAEMAVQAGFDGIELQAANGYLIEQFLNANINRRQDGYGGNASGRNRFALKVAEACVMAIGAHRVGMRLSPYGIFNGTGAFEEADQQYLALANRLSVLGLVYLHSVDHSSLGTAIVPIEFKVRLRAAFKNTFIAAGGFNASRAEQALQNGEADLIAFGRPYISNPDLVNRLQSGADLASPQLETFHTPGATGYTDYPTI